MSKGYWQQKATPWVSFAVLAGGLTAALLLFVVVRLEASLQNLATPISEYVEEETF